MTTVITRYFDDAAHARAIRFEMIHRQRLPIRQIHYFESADGLVETLTGEHVEAATAQAYAERMGNGGAVLMVRAGIKPLAMAKTTRQIFAAMGAQEIDGLVEEVFYKDPPRRKISVLDDHPFILSRPRDPMSDNYHMADWPIGLISRRKPFRYTIVPPHAHMANWPIPLIWRRKPNTASIFPRHARMANFPIPLISKRKPYTGSIIPRHGRMANFPIPLISRRKPYTKSLIPRHQRMATWPFPLLINGKTGKNALIPGQPHMANFPIPLLSDRKPYDAMVIPRHGRMANVILPLISKRKPYDKMAIDRHGRMADVILPLVLKESDTAMPDKDKRWSFSKLLGIPTVIRR